MSVNYWDSKDTWKSTILSLNLKIGLKVLSNWNLCSLLNALKLVEARCDELNWCFMQLKCFNHWQILFADNWLCPIKFISFKSFLGLSLFYLFMLHFYINLKNRFKFLCAWYFCNLLHAFFFKLRLLWYTFV